MANGGIDRSMGDKGGIGVRELTFAGNKTERSEMVTIQIDLTDPQDLLQKLELIDLTEEETDMLLSQATELNKQLRHLLELEKEDTLQSQRELRSFTVSAPAMKQSVKSAHRGIYTPSSPRSSYRNNAVFKDNSLARLQNGYPPHHNLHKDYSISKGNSSMSGVAEMNPLCNPYSYHSARPIHVKGNHDTSKRGFSVSGQYTSNMNDY